MMILLNGGKYARAQVNKELGYTAVCVKILEDGWIILSWRSQSHVYIHQHLLGEGSENPHFDSLYTLNAHY